MIYQNSPINFMLRHCMFLTRAIGPEMWLYLKVCEDDIVVVLVRLRGCTEWPELSFFAHAISTRADSFQNKSS